MSAIEIVVQASQQLEKALESMGATGRGLHEKTDSVSSRLPPAIAKRLHWIATVRNRVVHEGAGLDNPAEFQQAVQQTLQEIRLLASSQTATSPVMTRRYRSKRGSWAAILIFLLIIAIPLTHRYWRGPLYRLQHSQKGNQLDSSATHLFGANLATATRATLPPVLLHAGLQKLPAQSPWYQEYRVTNQLPGANRLLIWYTQSGRFAMAQYQFPSFMNTQKVVQVLRMVSQKYGNPSSQQGDPGLGSVHAHWDRPDHFEIRVYRGWPDMTVYLQIIDWKTYPILEREQKEQKQDKIAKLEQQHASAF